MRGFEPVTLSWKGENYTIPANEQMSLIATIEDALTGGTGVQAVVLLTQPEGISHLRLSRAYGAALRHGGADVTDEDIYLSIMNDFAEGNAEVSLKLQAAMMGLLAIVAPPVAFALSFGDSKKKSSDTDPG